jgi:CheY-like chemotaxis protein
MPRKNKVILIVDDDPDMRVYLRKLLEGLGHEVHEAGNSRTALKIIDDITPHLILLDINLDDESGFNMIGQIRMIDPYNRIKILMISSLSSKKAIDLSQKLGTDGYLIKPINNTTLSTTLKKMLPDLVFPDATNIEDKYSNLMAKFLGQLTKISEVSVILRSKIKFQEKRKIQIENLFLRKYDLMNAQLIIQEYSKDVTTGTYDTRIQLIGLNDNNLKSIRKLNTRKA